MFLEGSGRVNYTPGSGLESRVTVRVRVRVRVGDRVRVSVRVRGCGQG